MNTLKIQDTLIGDDSDCFVVAEIGHNHQGELERCKEMFKTAKECGADAVKLQKRDNKKLYTKNFYHAPYNSENAYGPTYGLHREALEFGFDEYKELKKYADKLGLVFFATAFDFSSTDFLSELDVPCFKIASGDITNIPLLTYVAKLNKPMIVSTGASDIEDVRRAYEAIMPINSQLAILQCTATYPTEPSELDLNVITTYKKEFPKAAIGLSDHYNGIALPVAAYVLGARIVEKHFTLNRALRGTDHAFSLEPIGLRKLVRDLRRTKMALGDGIKKIYESEESARMKMGKKMVASRDLPADHILSEDDITFKSPNNDGLPPYHAESLYGKKLKMPLEEDDTITFEHVE